MAAYEVLLLNTAIPQIQAAQTGDTYVVPRDIAFSAALTLSAGTANGVAYLNASKVATTSSNFTYNGSTTLSLSNSGNATYYCQSASGSIAKLDLTQSGVSSYTISTGSADALIFARDGTERMRLTSTGTLNIVGAGTAGSTQAISFNGSTPVDTLVTTSGGLVGIGTNAPTTKLYVTASVASTAIAAFFNTDTANGNGVYIKAGGANAGKYALAVDNAASASLLYLESSGNLGLGGSAARATTAGAAILNIFNGTAPVGTLANGISLYSSSGEAYVMDAAGNATLISPHDSETNEWIFKSKHTPTGKVLRIDVERLLRFVNDHFGLDAVKEFVEE